MRFIAYLNFDGRCAEAFDLYREVFGGEIVARFTYGESPMREQIPAEGHDRIMHCHLVADGAELMGADGPPPHEATGTTTVNIMVDTIEGAERIYATLSAGGTVHMPLQETFWAHRWGAFSDRYGKPWMVNCMKPPA